MAIPSTIRTAAERLLVRLATPGEIIDPRQFHDSHRQSGTNFPEWFVELMAEFPLAGIQIGVKVTEPFAGFEDEPVMFEWADSALLLELNTTSRPGMYLFPRGYVAIGCGIEWAGNILAMATDVEDPPLYEVWHDISNDPVELENAVVNGAPGTRLISSRLSDLLSEGLARPPFKP